MQNAKKDDPDLKIGDVAIIQLIKAGCFDNLENKSREQIMADFIHRIAPNKKTLSMSDVETLKQMNLLSQEQINTEYRYYKFRKYLYTDKFFVKANGKSSSTNFYKLDRVFAEPFFIDKFITELTEDKDYYYDEDGYIVVKRGSLDNLIDKKMINFKKEVLDNPKILEKVNEEKYNQTWQNKAGGSISKWEMDSIRYYYHEHELSHVNKQTHNISEFAELPPEPELEINASNNYSIRYKLVRICGTVIDKDKDHSTVTLLTTSGVAVVKLYKKQFIYYTNKTLDDSWFESGTKLMVSGFRSDENFIAKSYKDSLYKHTIQLIKDIDENGNLILVSEKPSEGEESE